MARFTVLVGEIEHDGDLQDATNTLAAAGAADVKVESFSFDEESARISFEAPSREAARQTYKAAQELGLCVD